MPNYKYNGEYNPVILHDIKGAGDKGVGMVVYTNQVISVDDPYIGHLNHSVFTPTKEKESTEEEVELLKPLLPRKKDQEEIIVRMESVEKLLKEALKANKTLEILNKAMTKKLEAAGV